MLLQSCYIQNVPGGKVNILGGHSIGHSKQEVYMYMCPIPNSFRDRAISLYTVQTLATRHVFTRVAKCIDVDGGIFENVL
jgi:oligoribonuclease (3'-5' exoribonuclease)